jgi:S1-C subfamily serine protease
MKKFSLLFGVSATALFMVLAPASYAFTWAQFMEYGKKNQGSGGSTYSRPSNSSGGSSEPSDDERASVAATSYCRMRSNGMDHTSSWDYVYGKMKDQTGLFGMFKMSPQRAADLITDKILNSDGSCIRYISDIRSPAPKTSKPLEPTQQPSTSVQFEQTAQSLKSSGGASDVARLAQAITVQIAGSGSTGSGVLINKNGNRYTVLTAMHVLAGQAGSETLEITTYDGKRYPVKTSRISKVDNADIASIVFASDVDYQVAKVSRTFQPSVGEPVFVAGYPLPTSAVPESLWRFLKGDVISYSSRDLPGGYRLLYSNPTLDGMSGGPVLNQAGELIAIHGRAEINDRRSDELGKPVPTGTRQGIPVDTYCRSYICD